MSYNEAWVNHLAFARLWEGDEVRMVLHIAGGSAFLLEVARPWRKGGEISVVFAEGRLWGLHLTRTLAASRGGVGTLCKERS